MTVPVLLAWYLAAGVAVTSAMLAVRFLRTRKVVTEKTSADDPTASSARLFVGRVELIVLCTVLWPLVLSFWVFDALKRDSVWPEDPPFEVRKADLCETLSAQEIESTEQVSDPLNAVPPLPFGHLNHCWRAFVDALPEGSELWSFRSQWKRRYNPRIRHGYAAVKNGSVGAVFVCECEAAE